MILFSCKLLTCYLCIYPEQTGWDRPSDLERQFHVPTEMAAPPRAFSSPFLRLHQGTEHQQTALSLPLLFVTGSLWSVVPGQILLSSTWVCNLNICIIIISFRACCLPMKKREWNPKTHTHTKRTTKNQIPKTPLGWPLGN